MKNYNIINKTTLLFLVMSLCVSIHAQEFLTGIGVNKQIAREALKQESLFLNEKSRYVQLFLPFFEDFSNYTGYPNERFFIDKQAFVNQSFPVFPPTIGVVTLDALNENGKIYPHLNDVPKGADTLTSHYIHLDYLQLSDSTSRIITLADSIYFSFYFQPGGGSIKEGLQSGNQPNTNDSLVLEFGYTYFKDTTNFTVWNHIWSTPGFSIDKWTSENPYQYFKQVMIPITDSIYLCDKFQFRFRNYASLEPQQGIPGWEGNVDQWHIDYIRLDIDRRYDDEFTNDLAFVSPTTSFLKNYQAMPWKQFQQADVKPNFTNQLTNLSDGKRTPRYKYLVTQNGSIVHEYHKISELEDLWEGAKDIDPYYTHWLYQNDPVTKPPISFTPHLSEPTSLVVTHIFTNNSDGDFCAANDTCIFEQKFQDYYAYDDGTAEYGYCLNNQYNIAKLAMKFSLRVPDSLSAVRMWFNHTKNDENKEAQFSIVVWKDNNGQPGEEIFKSDEYRPKFDSLQFLDFVEYRFNKKILVSGNIWVGFEQKGNVQLNIGFDQNNDSREFFKYNTNGNWTTSSFAGTPMLRPVFGNPVNLNIHNPKIATVKLWPNPTTGEFRVSSSEFKVEHVEVYDVLGRKQKAEGRMENGEWRMNLSHLFNGIYFIRIFSENNAVETMKIIKN